MRACFAAANYPTNPVKPTPELSAEQQREAEQDILDDLKIFDCRHDDGKSQTKNGFLRHNGGIEKWVTCSGATRANSTIIMRGKEFLEARRL